MLLSGEYKGVDCWEDGKLVGDWVKGRQAGLAKKIMLRVSKPRDLHSLWWCLSTTM